MDFLSQHVSRSRHPKVTLDRRDLPAPMGQDALRVEVHIPPKEEQVPLPNMARSAVYTGECGVI